MSKTPEEYFQEVSFSAVHGSGGAFSAAELTFIRKYMGIDAPEALRKLGLDAAAAPAEEPAGTAAGDSSPLEAFIADIDEVRPVADVPRSIAEAVAEPVAKPAPVKEAALPAAAPEEPETVAAVAPEEPETVAAVAPEEPETVAAAAPEEPETVAAAAPEPAAVPEAGAEAAARPETPAVAAPAARPVEAAPAAEEGEELPPELIGGASAPLAERPEFAAAAPAPVAPPVEIAPVLAAKPAFAAAPAASAAVPPAAQVAPAVAPAAPAPAEPEEEEAPKIAPDAEKPRPSLADIYDGMDIQDALTHFLKHEAELQMVAFYLGNQEFVVPTVIVQEVIHYTTPAKLPAAPPFVAGVINLRGKVTPLMYLRDILEVKAKDGARDRFIIVCRFQGLQVGLIIERVHSMYRVPQKDIDWGIEAHLGINVDYVSGLLKLNERLVGIVSVDKIVANLLVEEGL